MVLIWPFLVVGILNVAVAVHCLFKQEEATYAPVEIDSKYDRKRKYATCESLLPPPQSAGICEDPWELAEEDTPFYVSVGGGADDPAGGYAAVPESHNREVPDQCYDAGQDPYSDEGCTQGLLQSAGGNGHGAAQPAA